MKSAGFIKYLFFFLLFVASCTKEPRPNPGDTHADAPANRWIYEKMKEEYLYNYKVKAIANPNYNRPCEVFFQSLLSSSSMDNDGKHPDRYGNYTFYSYMERTGPGVSGRLTKSGSTLSYGFQFVVMQFGTNYLARVLYVHGGSAAASAGLKRGDWIKKIGSEYITLDNYGKLTSGGPVTITVCRNENAARSGATLDLSDEEQISLGLATIIDDKPVFLSKVFDAGAHKIGYMVYNSFDPGSGSAYDNAMKTAFFNFKQQGATDIIIDLRYNGGGYVSCAQLMASMMLPVAMLPLSSSDNVNIFGTGEFNADLAAKGRKETFRFENRSAIENYNLDLQSGARIIVLTGRWTASASELIINALNPYVESYAADGGVRIIGRPTEGKNVGSYEISNSSYGITLHPIVLTFSNRDGESDYSQGFVPASGDEKNELDISTDNVQFHMRELGDEEEYLLRYAIAAITGVPVSGSLAPSPLESRSTGEGRVVASSLDMRSIQGAITDIGQEYE